MATTFTWMIDELERNSSDDGIHHARWICRASISLSWFRYSSKQFKSLKLE